jgi:O-antigen/teichoic acid export membrane protein
LNQDRSPPDSEDANKLQISRSGDFVTPSLFLFLDSFLVSLAGWIYWIVISKLTLSSELGIAVTVYSLVMLIARITELGIEYPLLKKSGVPGSQILGTSIVIELILTLASIPFVFLIINNLYDESIKQFTWISAGLLVILSVEFVARFALLGISNSRAVLLIDLIGLVIKFSTGFILVYLSYGALGILLAYLVEALFLACTQLLVLHKSFSLRLGNIGYFKEVIKDALINTPAKWSKMVIVSLSIVLLAFLNVSNSDIGIFYVALMITIVVASFATSLAYMVIPSSSSLKKDLSSSSLRISLSLTTPIVVALLVIPRTILSLIGPEYESAQTVLFVLALAIIPSSITINMITKLNNLNKSKLLILTGTLQILIFFISFFILVPIYGTTGAGISILVAFLVSSLLLIFLTDHDSFRYIVFTCLSILAGFSIGYMISLMLGYEHQLLILISSVATSILVIFASKNMTIKEVRYMVKVILHKK